VLVAGRVGREGEGRRSVTQILTERVRSGIHGSAAHPLSMTPTGRPGPADAGIDMRSAGIGTVFPGRPHTEDMSSRLPARGRVLPTSPFVRKEVTPPSTAGFSVGDRVTLDSCGMGRVVQVTEVDVLVDFGTEGQRRIPAGTKGFSRL